VQGKSVREEKVGQGDKGRDGGEWMAREEQRATKGVIYIVEATV
jgi:hypothetical protein